MGNLFDIIGVSGYKPPADPAPQPLQTPLDVLKQWIADHTSPGQNYTGILHASYSRYCDQIGIQPLGLTTFGIALGLLGYSGPKDRRGKLLPLTLKRVALPPNAPRKPKPPADQPPEPTRRQKMANLKNKLGIR